MVKLNVIFTAFASQNDSDIEVIDMHTLIYRKFIMSNSALLNSVAPF